MKEVRFLPLVEVDEEDDVVAEAGEAVHGGHLDDEGEHCRFICWVWGETDGRMAGHARVFQRLSVGTHAIQSQGDAWSSITP